MSTQRYDAESFSLSDVLNKCIPSLWFLHNDLINYIGYNAFNASIIKVNLQSNLFTGSYFCI